MKKYLDRYFTWIFIAALGIAAWWWGSKVSGDVYAVAIGPDALVNIPLSIVKLCAVVILTSAVEKWRSQTTHDFFSRKKDAPKSEFGQSWQDISSDTRIQVAAYTRLGIFIGICILL